MQKNTHTQIRPVETRRASSLAIIVLIIICNLSFTIHNSQAQSVVIDDDNNYDTTDAMLQIEAGVDNKGLLIPRILYANRPSDTIVNDALLYYFTDGDGSNGEGFYYYEHTSTSWLKIANPTNLVLNEGNVFVGDNSNEAVGLDASGDGQLLVGNGTTVTSVAMSGDVAITSAGVTEVQDNAVDGTDIALGSDAIGDIMYYDGTDWAILAAGTSGYYLKANGAAAPSWLDPSSTGAWNLTGNTGTTVGGSFFGTTDYEDISFMVGSGSPNGGEVMRFSGEDDDQIGFVGIGNSSPLYPFDITGSLNIYTSPKRPSPFVVNDTICVKAYLSSVSGGAGSSHPSFGGTWIAGDFYCKTVSSTSGTMIGLKARAADGNDASNSAGISYGIYADGSAGKIGYGIYAKGKAATNDIDYVATGYGGYFEGEISDQTWASKGLVYGIYAKANENCSGNNYPAYGVYSTTSGGSSSYGLYADATSGTTSYGVYAASGHTYAGYFDGNTTTTGDATIAGGDISMTNATSNRLNFPTAGLGLPTFTTRSAGTKLVFYPAISGTAVDYGLGINGFTQWYSVPVANGSYKHSFYAGTSEIASINGAGNMSTRGSMISIGHLDVTADKHAYVDLYAHNASALSFRLWRIPGINSDMRMYNAGTGSIVWYTDETQAMSLSTGGNLTIVGSLSKGSGTFKIDHPSDPKNKYLYHSFVESPDMMNIYNGNVTTDENGNATVQLPGYFKDLNVDFRYQLTVIGTFAQAIIDEKISDNTFKIKTDKPKVEVSWQVTGVRNDPYAVKNRVIPEVEKEEDKKGTYLHPAAYKGK